MPKRSSKRQAPEIEVVFSGAYGIDRLEKTIATLQPLLTLRRPALITVDLRRLVHFGPASLALLIATLHRVSEMGLVLPDGRVIMPKSPSVRNYLERMNLLERLVVDESHQSHRRNPPQGFRPCEHFASGDDYWEVAKSLAESLTERCEVDEIGRAAIRVCLDEVCENVIHHADTTLGGFAAAQGYPNGKKRQFEIGIVDLGVGIRASLAKNAEYANITDDATAISTALRARVTSTPDRNAGIGLYVTSMVLRNNGGHVLVRSGHGQSHRGALQGDHLVDAHLPGTVVAVRANMDRPLDLTPVYAELDELDNTAQAENQHDDHHARDDQAR